jgi:hypothetical protein
MRAPIDRIARETLPSKPVAGAEPADSLGANPVSAAPHQKQLLSIETASKRSEEVRSGKAITILRVNAPAKACCSTSLLLLPAMIGALTGCGDLYLDAPSGANISLMPENKPAAVRVEQVVWFKYWGNEPFSEPETHAATIIQDQQLKEARVRMVNTVLDGVITTFTGPFGFPRRTLIVEGNRRPKEENPSTNPQDRTD